MMAFEVSKTLNYQIKDVTTPLGVAKTSTFTDDIVVATIFRAGLPFHQGFLDVFGIVHSSEVLPVVDLAGSFVQNREIGMEEHFELTNTALRTAGVVTLTVTDNHGDPVEGAAFTLYDSTGRALETGRLSEADGKIVAGPLDAGTYYFEQTGTPEDYKMPGNICTDSFTVIDHPGDPQLFNLSMSNMLKGKGTVTVTAVYGSGKKAAKYKVKVKCK